MADITMGFLFVHEKVEPLRPFVWLMVASSCLYTAGMVLNDVFDIEVDRRERPERPLPSGQISVRWARWLGFILLVFGVIAAGLAGVREWFDSPNAFDPWRAGAVAGLLATCVVLYDIGLKKTIVGPVAMGACRFFNVLLGMSTASLANAEHTWFLQYSVSQLLVAGGIGVYIVGVTWFARTEATKSRRGPLLLAVAVMCSGLYLLTIFPDFDRRAIHLTLTKAWLWPVVVVLLAMPIVRRCLRAVMNPTPQRVQDAVKLCIFSLILLDAAVCVAMRGYIGMYLIALLVLGWILGRWVYST
jgi:4-hydroxybenzoate polyprenyltransferase